MRKYIIFAVAVGLSLLFATIKKNFLSNKNLLSRQEMENVSGSWIYLQNHICAPTSICQGETIDCISGIFGTSICWFDSNCGEDGWGESFDMGVLTCIPHCGEDCVETDTSIDCKWRHQCWCAPVPGTPPGSPGVCTDIGITPIAAVRRCYGY